MLKIGSLVDGKYKILNEIGHGGMSVVYLAIVERANQTWAIKEVRKNGINKDDVVEQGLVAEMNILKRLNHPHLPRIIDIIDHDESFLIVMDYIEGIDLDKKLRKGPQKWSDVVEWAKQLCDVLAYLHSRQPPIIYRDMKPGNVKLKPSGDVVLFDFGTAREYKSQRAGDDTTCLGTRGYAAPEQYGGMGQTDARSDIYCLGATMFHLVTGKLPGGPPEYDIPPIRKICPWLPRTGQEGNAVRGLEKIIAKCTMANPAYRYQNCAELMYDLEHIDRITDEFVKKQRGKLRAWAACAAASVVLFCASGMLSVASTKTKTSSYDDLLRDSFSDMGAEQRPGSSDYEAVRDSLVDAIDVDPENPKAWIYMAKLFRSDYVITNDEYSYMKTQLSMEKNKSFRENKSGYAQFCMEWGEDLFFFYSNNDDVSVGSGAPDKAQMYLSTVVGDEGEEEESVKRLISKENNDDVKDSYKIRDITDIDSAQDEYELAQSLQIIAEQYEQLGKSSAYDSGTKYSYSEYWSNLEDVLEKLNNLSDGSSGVNISLVRCSIYSNVMSAVHMNFIYFYNEGKIPISKIQELSSVVLNDSEKLKTGLTAELKESYSSLLDNIENMYNNILDDIKSVSVAEE